MYKFIHGDEGVSDEEFDTIFALGANFFSQGKYLQAQTIFAGLMVLDENDEKSAIAFGEALLCADEHEKAWAHFLALKARFSSNSRVILCAAKCAMLLHKFDQALELVSPLISGQLSQPANVLLEAKAIYLWLIKLNTEQV